MVKPSDMSPAGAAESGRGRAEGQAAPEPRVNEYALRDLDAPDGEALKGGGIPKRPDSGGDCPD